MSTPGIAEPYVLTATRHGVMLVNRHDYYMGQAMIIYGECCEIESRFLHILLSKSGLVIEVGANMGIHTIPLAAHLAGQGRRMLVFEPQPVIFQQLCANLALNGLTNVRAFPYACGSKNGSVMFRTPDYRATGNFGGTEMQETAEDSSQCEVVQCARLDDLVPEGEVGLIKIDVEGFEEDVLRGSEAILSRCTPYLYIENDRTDKSPALIQWLFDHDYRLWWHIPPLFNPANFRGVAEDLYKGVSSFNMLGVHRSVNVSFRTLSEVTDPAFHPLLQHA